MMIRFDGLLDQKRSIVIQSSIMKYKFLQEPHFSAFLDMVEAGKGAELDKNNIDQFVMLLPAEDEIRKFRGRLEDYGLESFQDLEREAPLSKG